jgi:hypothetical protein
VLKDPNFASQIITEESVQRWLALLLKNVNEPAQAANSTATNSTPASAPSLQQPLPTVAAPPSLSKSGPPGVTPPALNYAATFKRDNVAGWNT